MSSIKFDNRRFSYVGNDGRAKLLLDAFDIYENHSTISMTEVEPRYGKLRQDKPFLGTLLKHLEPLKEKKRMGYAAVVLLMVRELWKKHHAVRVLRVGGSSVDALSMESAAILKTFHPDSLLYCMSRDGIRLLPVDNIFSIPMELKDLPLMQQQFAVLLLDDTRGEVSPELVHSLLPTLHPFGRFFCLTAREELMAECSKAMPQLEKMPMEGNLCLLTQELSHEDWARAWMETPQGKLEHWKREAARCLELLRVDTERLESCGGGQQEDILRRAKEFEFSVAEMYPSLASIDAKMLATQFREALIDWHLGNAEPTRVKACFAALQEDLRRYHDIGNEWEWEN
ncbi:MAG: hypothetical protein IJT01_11480 [Selenomonadaceae bacterium]|nr:hypothetical protein [Selenomonadaceae bacterium]